MSEPVSERDNLLEELFNTELAYLENLKFVHEVRYRLVYPGHRGASSKLSRKWGGGLFSNFQNCYEEAH